MSGGFNDQGEFFQTLKDSEIVDLSAIDTNCQSIRDHPEALYGAVGFWYKDEITICGGISEEYGYSGNKINISEKSERSFNSIFYLLNLIRFQFLFEIRFFQS